MSEFLAEARVLVRPDLTGFRAQLQAELLAATKGVTIPIPVAAAPAAGATAGITRAANQQAAAAGVVAAQTTKAAGAQNALTKAQTAGAAASAKLALAQKTVFNALTPLSAAQITATRSAAALAAAQRAVDLAVVAGDPALIKTTQETLRLAEAQQLEATAALKAARAQAVHSSQLAFGSRGATTGALTLLGVRGATLAANAAFLAGAAAFAVFAKSVRAAADLEEELNVFRVTAEATANEMTAVSDAAKQLGADITLPAVSAGDAAQAMVELAKAGLTVQDSMDAARGTLQLATAAEIDNADATNIVASALNAFGLAGSQAEHVADLLAASSIEAQGTISDVGDALRNVAPVARQAGISLEDTVSMLTLLAKNGIQGANGGTVLRVALLRLINPSEEATRVIENLGLRIRDSLGRIRPEVFADFGRLTAELTAKQRDMAAAIVFGDRGIRGQAVLAREGADALRAMGEATNRAGAVNEIAGAKTRGFTGRIDALKSGLETLGIELGKTSIPLLERFVETAQEGAIALQGLADAGEEFERSAPSGEGGFLSGLLGGLRDLALASGGDVLREIRAERDLLLAGKPAIDPFKTPSETIERLNRDLRESVGGASELSTALRNISRAEGIQAAVQLVRDLKAQVIGSSEEAQKLREFFEGIERVLTALGRAPTVVELQAFIDKGFIPKDLREIQSEVERSAIEIQAKLGRDSLVFVEQDVASAAEKAADLYAQFFGDALPDALQATVNPDIFTFPSQAEQGGKDTAAAFAEGFAGQPLRLAQQIAAAEAGGNEEEILRLERIRLARRRAFQRRREAIAREDPTVKNVALAKEAAENVKESEDRIKAIESRRAADSERAAQDIVTARNKADQAVIDSIDLEGSRRRNALARAQLTKKTSDDVARAKELVAYYERALKTARNSIKDAKTKAQEIAVLTSGLISAEETLVRAQEQAAEARRRIRRERRERKEEGLQLTIQIAEATGNVKKEIKARENYIKWLEQQIKKTRGNQRKRYILALRQEQAELREIRSEQRKTGDEFKRLTFDFLTMQQGFAANLFGNLIPTSFTGLVGTPSPTGGGGGAAAVAREIPMGLRRAEGTEIGGPGTELGRETALARAGEGGMTRGQAMTEIEVLKSINRGIQQLLRGLGFREAQHQREKTAQSSGGGGVQVQ